MNNIRTQKSKQTIRFKRWSRKGYAIFSGLKKEVTIGETVTKISDKSLTKLKKNIREIVNLTQSQLENKEELEEQQCLITTELQTVNIRINYSHDKKCFIKDKFNKYKSIG